MGIKGLVLIILLDLFIVFLGYSEIAESDKAISGFGVLIVSYGVISSGFNFRRLFYVTIGKYIYDNY